MGRTLYEKIWDDHAIGDDLLYVDLHLVHEVTSAQAFEGLRLAGRRGAAARPHDRDGRPQRAHARIFALGVEDDLAPRSSSTRSTRNCEEFGVRLLRAGATAGRASCT